ncbi:Alternate F1F0 ATPase, F1 subunit epsilon [Hyella patelloides LEGE 07179]|uniref:Alternate F1F0 ATPase, F1 subunit epsilon n=1 Tax=Hyella patelloides LEGE 07179 TaxID=945734 RepID=A0A563VT16_9CYAN|nr:F0F1 ATP synthase subunit epsilon [Hyella patelloides]VEP14538.1 Alternate F1F0 ATPase, F1 subunit epsilon [Hyella patelloides LEGE 07179]
MKLKVLIPTEVLIDREVTKVIAEAENGHFCLLPHHIDFATALAPGILSYTVETEEEIFVAVDEGILVKCDREVLVSTRNAIEGNNLETLQQTVAQQFQILDEKEKLTRSVLAKFEASMMRHFKELGHG